MYFWPYTTSNLKHFSGASLGVPVDPKQRILKLDPFPGPLCSSFSISGGAVAGADALGCPCLGNAMYVRGHCFDLGRKGAFLQLLLLQSTKAHCLSASPAAYGMSTWLKPHSLYST